MTIDDGCATKVANQHDINTLAGFDTEIEKYVCWVAGTNEKSLKSCCEAELPVLSYGWRQTGFIWSSLGSGYDCKQADYRPDLMRSRCVTFSYLSTTYPEPGPVALATTFDFRIVPAENMEPMGGMAASD